MPSVEVAADWKMGAFVLKRSCSLGTNWLKSFHVRNRNWLTSVFSANSILMLYHSPLTRSEAETVSHVAE